MPKLQAIPTNVKKSSSPSSRNSSSPVLRKLLKVKAAHNCCKEAGKKPLNNPPKMRAAPRPIAPEMKAAPKVAGRGGDGV